MDINKKITNSCYIQAVQCSFSVVIFLTVALLGAREMQAISTCLPMSVVDIYVTDKAFPRFLQPKRTTNQEEYRTFRLIIAN